MWNIESVKKSTYKIVCGSEQGTAFFVSKNELLTAWHVVSGFFNGEKIYLCYEENRYECEASVVKENVDVALIKCSKFTAEVLKLSSIPKISEMKLKIFGYPQSRIGAQIGFDLALKTSQHYENLKEDFDSYAEIIDDRRISIMNGFSGSPVFVEDGTVVGVVTDKLDCHIGFVSIESIEKALESKKISCDRNFYKYDNSPYGWIENKKIVDDAIKRVGRRFQPELHQNDPNLENKINRLWDLSIEENEEKRKQPQEIRRISNDKQKRFLFLFGNAGVGKTHQMCHYAQKLINESKTNVYLCLGMQFDNVKTDSLEGTFANLCNFPQSTGYLEKLNENAQKRNVRYLFIIDAINEGLDKNFWQREIPVFVEKISEFENLALIVTIRKPFEKEYGIDGNFFSSYELKGFVNPLQAKNSFFSYYGIPQDAAPLNFENGLLLSLFCRTYKNIPIYERKSLKSIIGLFYWYVLVRNYKISELVDEDSDRNVTHEYLLKLSAESINNGCQPVSRDIARRISYKSLYRQWSKSLLFTLMKENLLLANYEDSISFEYELMENVYQAIALYQKTKNAKDSIYFLKNLLKNVGITVRVHNFIVVATSVWNDLFKEDIFFNSLFDKSLLPYYIEGTKYKNEIDIKVLNEIKKNTQYGMFSFFKISLRTLSVDNQSLLTTLLDELKKMNMHNRDLYWTEAVNQCYDDDEIRYLLSDYIPNEENKRDDAYNKNFVELLCWTCSSSYPIVRTLAIRHLVTLLLRIPQYTVELLMKFQQVDDAYVLDGLYSALYGFVLMSDDKEKIGNIAKNIYEFSFKNKEPYPDLRVREWMLRILDRDRFVNKSSFFDESKPPYKSTKINYVDDVDSKIKQLRDSFDKSKGTQMLVSSIFGWSDFNRYIIGTNSSHEHYDISSVSLKESDDVELQRFSLNQEIYQIGNTIRNLDWDENLGNLDNNRTSINRMENERERIGKKYQWISLYNVEARLLDMYKLYDEYNDSNEIYRKLNYPWYTSRRSYFDPTLGISFANIGESKYESIKEVDFSEETPNEQWLKKSFTKSNVGKILNYFDEEKNKWILLQSWQILRNSASQPKDSFVLYNSYFVENEYAESFAKWISRKELYGRWMPEIRDNIDFILYEFAWSSRENWDKYKRMQYVGEDCPCQVLPGTCSQLQEEHMGVRDDFSGNVYLPNPDIMEVLDLHIFPGCARSQSVFADKDGIIKCCSIKRNGMDYVYLRKDALESYLEKRNYSMFAALATEKFIRKEKYDYDEKSFRTSSCAVKYDEKTHNFVWLSDFKTKKE